MFLFTFMLTILCFTYHFSSLFWVTFPWPGYVHSTLESCAHDIDKCLLYINDSETEMLIIHAKDRPALLLDKL